MQPAARGETPGRNVERKKEERLKSLFHNRHSERTGKLLLVLCNVILLLAVIGFAIGYSSSVRADQQQTARDTFCSTVETMKQISIRYLDGERNYVRDWAAYIEDQNMTEDEALEYLRTINSSSDCVAHIVDMDTFAARSSYRRTDGDDVSTYQTFLQREQNGDTNMQLFVENMQRMYSGKAAVLGKYKIYESQITAISVGERVNLKQADGSTKGYLLLRVIPVESMKKNWIFPTEYAAAEIGLITQTCDYVIASNAMRSENFIEFVRAYSFPNDYNKADELLTRLAENSSGLLSLKNSKGEDCYWYYSRLDGYEGLDILGYIPQAKLYRTHDNWTLVVLICGTVLLLALLDGAYILSINRRLRETAKLAEQASEAKTQFLSSMSHDIRTPLNAVLGMTELAKKRVDDAPYVQECLNKISVSGGHLLTLINDVLEISKVESGKTTLNPAPFAVDELVDNLESITRSQADGRGLQFTVERPPLAYPALVGDKLRLSQVYLNLLTNAVKYTNAGGAVRLEVQEEPCAEEGKAVLVCSVADNGIGMSEEFQQTMYDSFARAADSRIDKTQGTGLGLAIVRRMVELMGGTVDCASTLGEGTTFTVRIALPTARVEDLPRTAAVPENDADGGDLNGVRILIAEDNDLNWEIIQTMLEEQGIRCTRAEDGQKCIDQLMEAPPDTYDLVLMDVQMPVLNGRDAARWLRRCERADLRSIPIAAMTADAFAEDVQACLDAGMDAHLAKPVDLEKVLATIRRLRRKNSPA